MIITSALCALSLRALAANRTPHLSEDEIREHHAFCLHPRVRTPRSGVGIFSLPAPSTASLAEMSEFFESRCTPKDFREARSYRAFNARFRREFGAKAAAHA